MRRLHRACPRGEIPRQRLFAEGEPILANRRVAAGQDISFELPEDGAGVAPQPEIPVKVVYEDAFAIVLESRPTSRCTPR